MGACHTFYDELRFDTTDPHLTHVYCYIRTQGDCPHFIQGWHHKAFSAEQTTKHIYDLIWDGKEEPMNWPLKAPDSPERNRTLDEVVKVLCDEAMEAAIGTGNGDAHLYAAARRVERMKS